jgi:hypothetical protein
VGDWVRQAKADFIGALLCPQSNMAPILAVAGIVADHHRFDGDSTRLESFINRSQKAEPDLFLTRRTEMVMKKERDHRTGNRERNWGDVFAIWGRHISFRFQLLGNLVATAGEV